MINIFEDDGIVTLQDLKTQFNPSEIREGYREITGLDNDKDFTDEEIYLYMLEVINDGED